ncbi:izumo sperm-egg fusion protein 1 [Salarias fasciatus]|uniref:izumo sperm-egg fusion protein 1 n=1 Tax=Salarias fasciatus TaxID=181472 RepID=UPI001177037D|nr:izumo sperm-egg fusion protein 1 [Salarias fasciatus]
MQMTLLFLLCCIPAAMACLQCDRTVKVLHEDFILSAPTVNDQIELQKISDHAYVTYRETSQARKGVIGPITFDTIQIMEKGRGILEKHLDAFIQDGLCPNKCGLLNRRVMDCVSCRKKIYICPSPTGQQDCGEYPVQAEEGGQAVLDCFRPWHRLLLGRPEYHYSWSPGVPGTQQLNESEFATLVVTDESSLILNQLHVTEQGTYRCSLQDRNGTIFYGVAFLLSVALSPPQTHRPLVTLPPVPHGDKYSPSQPTEEQLLSLITMAAALGVTASVGLIVLLRKKCHLISPRKKGIET